MAFEKDNITVTVYDRDDPLKVATRIDKWESYTVTDNPPWGGAGKFTMTPTPSKDVWDLFRVPGQKIEIKSGEDLQFTGIIEEVDDGATPDSKSLTIAGRDLMGLLVDACAPRMSVRGKKAYTIFEDLLDPWYPDWIKGITANNAVNFYRVAGLAKSTREVAHTNEGPSVRTVPKQVAYADQNTKYPKLYSAAGVKKGGYTGQITSAHFMGPHIKYRTDWKVRGGKNSPYFRGLEDPTLKRIRGGEKVKDIIDDILKMIACTCWFTADAWLFAGRPRYNHQPYGKLVFKKGQTGLVEGVERSVSIAERFSIWQANAQRRSSKSNRGRAVNSVVFAHDPSPAFWATLSDGTQRARLYKPCIFEKRHGCQGATMLRRLVRTKAEESIVKALTYNWQVAGHRDPISGLLWNRDACVELQDEVRGIGGIYWIAGVERTKESGGGTSSQLTVIPANIWLALDHDNVTDEEWSEWINSRVIY